MCNSCSKLVLVLILLFIASSTATATKSTTSRRAFFVFGDSLVDTRNNNYLYTTARADYLPNGIDSPSHMPSGRFSNGLSFPDVLGEAMGLEPILPCLSPEINGSILNGANFASAGVGILNDTGIQFINILKIDRQLELFEEYQKIVGEMIGEKLTKQLVNKAIVLITLGGNDFINNYFRPFFPVRRFEYSVPDYCKLLISSYKIILMNLYELGARRVIVTGTGSLGCTPVELVFFGSQNGECVTEIQNASSMYNSMLFEMIKVLNSEVGSDVYVAAHGFSLKDNNDVLMNPKKFGFVTSKVACCGQGAYNGLGSCTPMSSVCSNRDEYVFWDAFHPTEKGNRIIVQQLLNATSDYMYPMNLSTIMALDSTN